MASPNGAKAFIAISSMAVLVTDGPIASVGYCISKFAQLRVVEFIATQYGKDGLLAVAIHPGGVKTELAKAAPEGFDKRKATFMLVKNVCSYLSSLSR